MTKSTSSPQMMRGRRLRHLSSFAKSNPQRNSRICFETTTNMDHELLFRWQIGQSTCFCLSLIACLMLCLEYQKSYHASMQLIYSLVRSNHLPCVQIKCLLLNLNLNPNMKFEELTSFQFVIGFHLLDDSGFLMSHAIPSGWRDALVVTSNTGTLRNSTC
jgi:hypothetical protein